MIAGVLESWRDHLRGDSWERAFGFLQSLDADAPEVKTNLDGEDVFAIVMSYPTRGRHEANVEAHNRYIDIQMSLVNAEGIDWFPRGSLASRTEYNEQTDKIYYHRPEGPATVHLDMRPGQFVVLYPGDAHQCQLVVDEAMQVVKKVVVKVAVHLVK